MKRIKECGNERDVVTNAEGLFGSPWRFEMI